MCSCPKCKTIEGVLFLLLGLVFFGANLGWWSFWNIQWYSALFVLVGVSKLAKGKCKDCCNMCGSMAKGRKR